MKIYEKYILNLLIVRFSIILFFVSIFGIFQEMAKGDILKFCSFWQSIMILPITLPFLLFQFLPFVYFGTLLMVLNKLHSKNELLSLKTIGISNKKITAIFFHFAAIVLLFFILTGLIYPSTNKLFFKLKNNFKAINVLNVLYPKTINEFGDYMFFFSNIDKHNVMHNVSIFANKKNGISMLQDENDIKNSNKKIIFSKSMSFGYNNFNELVAHCEDNDVLTIKNTHDNVNNTTVEQVVHSDYMDVLIDEFFKLKTTVELRYKQKLRQTSLIDLFLKKDVQDPVQNKMRKTEIYSRVVIYWFVLLTITSVCCLLLIRESSRFSEKKIMAIVIVVGSVCALWRAFLLEGIVFAGLEFVHLLYFVPIFVFCLFFSIRK